MTTHRLAKQKLDVRRPPMLRMHAVRFSLASGVTQTNTSIDQLIHVDPIVRERLGDENDRNGVVGGQLKPRPGYANCIHLQSTPRLAEIGCRKRLISDPVAAKARGTLGFGACTCIGDDGA